MKAGKYDIIISYLFYNISSSLFVIYIYIYIYIYIFVLYRFFILKNLKEYKIKFYLIYLIVIFVLFCFILTLPKNLKIARYNDFSKEFNVLSIINDMLYRDRK